MSEVKSVQNPMLYYAEEIGWEIVSPQEAHELRGGDETAIYFPAILKAQLLKLNPEILDDAGAEEIIRQLNLLQPTIEGNREALAWIKGQHSLFDAQENRERNISLIDFENFERNIFQITSEWRQQGVIHANRADVVLLINGIPVSVAEAKTPEKLHALEDGIEQIRRYHRETPALFTATQVFEVTQMLDFLYGASWSVGRKNIFRWKTATEGEAVDYETRVKSFFDRSRFLRVLHDYIVFITKEGELSKVILRQHQMRAVEKVLHRAGDSTKKRGLVWHTQGSGKTLTMITIAAKLLRGEAGAKPTVLMVIDRNELESQLTRNIEAYGISKYKLAGSKKELREILASDYRGLVISMIHKFDNADANLNTRDSIVVLVDEAHRTTGGDLGNYLVAALPHATFIGFTGTPIDRLASGKGTFKVFGVDDDRGYLDKYSIAESIDDKTTLELHYALAPSHLLVDKDTLEKEFLNRAEAEGISDVEELNEVLKRAVKLREMMKAPKRVEAIAAFVAKHYQENVEPMGFKAFLVGVDREACVLYKAALDKLLPPDYSQVVYSPAHNDTAELKQYHLTSIQEEQIRKDFASKAKLPKILIVTEKLLTGYDAPILYAMYLDKPMRDHVLLQSIARVNRPYEDKDGLVKPCGLVFDFVGIFENVKKALAFDSEEVAAVIENIDVLKRLFEKLMKAAEQSYIPLAGRCDDKAKEKAILHFQEEETREQFFKDCKDIANLYEILSPDVFLRPYISAYKTLTGLFLLVKNAYADRIYVDREFTRKTTELLREHSSGGEIDAPGEIHTLDKETLDILKTSDNADLIKVLNLKKVLRRTLDDEAEKKPYLASIAEMAQKVTEAFEKRQLSSQEALKQLTELTEQYLEADQEKSGLGLDDNEYTVYSALNLAAGDFTMQDVKAVNALFEEYPDYGWNSEQERKLRAELYKALRPLVGAKRMIETANVLLKLERV